ncbi:MAG: hypothetical protein DSM106950_00380 [Stigonema ocellatum SAG 48.90 = DSM 106950]|nr:hypothetical protein [Stigonema ocellatum SAG 48.90 = DSM 106950]
MIYHPPIVAKSFALVLCMAIATSLLVLTGKSDRSSTPHQLPTLAAAHRLFAASGDRELQPSQTGTARQS